MAELVSPGFGEDLSTWTFSVDADGAAIQDVVVSNSQNMYAGEARVFVTQVSKTEVEEILAAAEAGGFGRFESNYTANGPGCLVLDASTNALSFLMDDDLKRVEVYAADTLAYHGSPEMKVFCALWDRIERLQPYRPG